MVCLLHAAQEAGLPYQAIILKSLGRKRDEAARLRVDGGKPDFTDETKALLADGTGPVLSFVGGIQHVHVALRTLYDPSAPAFDFELPGAPHLRVSPAVERIPFDAMHELLAWRFRSRMKLLDKVARLAPGRVFHFAPPPPVSDRWIDVALRERDLTPDHLPDRSVRWKVWRLTADLFREHAEACGARFLEAPEASMDADGFLRDDLARNLTHGNTAFGALLLQQVRAVQ